MTTTSSSRNSLGHGDATPGACGHSPFRPLELLSSIIRGPITHSRRGAVGNHMRMHGMNSTRSLVTAAAGLTLVLTAAPARALLGQVPQTSQDSANRPWVVDRGGTWGQPADTTTTTPAS